MNQPKIQDKRLNANDEKRRTRRDVICVEILTCVLCFACCVLFGCAQKSDQVCFGNRCFDVEVAEKPQALTRGLQFRSSLPENSGMLFVFPRSDVYKFWMKDTLIPLDMIWIDAEKRIVEIVHNALPCKEDPCPNYGSGFFAAYVLEVNAGQAGRFGLKAGDQVKFRFLQESH